MYSANCEVKSEILVPAISFDQLEFNPQSDFASFCSIYWQDEKTIVTRMKVKGPSISAIEMVALSVTTQILFRLEGNFGLLTGASLCNTRDVKDESGGGVVVARGRIMLPIRPPAAVTTERSAIEIRSLIEVPMSSKDTYFELYHHARVAKNPTVQFLGYYQIIAALLGDPQQKVIDDFFVKNDPAMPPFTENPSRPGRFESVYTRLRNEVAHVRPRSGSDLPKDPVRVHAEIEQYCHRLSLLARTAIRQLLQ